MKEIIIKLKVPDNKIFNIVRFKRLLRKESIEYKIIQPTEKICCSKGFNLQ